MLKAVALPNFKPNKTANLWYMAKESGSILTVTRYAARPSQDNKIFRRVLPPDLPEAETGNGLGAAKITR